MRLFSFIPLNHLVQYIPQVRNRHLLVADVYLLPVAALLAFIMRLDPHNYGHYAVAIWGYVVLSLLIKLPVFAFLGVYARFWRYANAEDALLLVTATATSGVAVSGLYLGVFSPLTATPDVPLSIPLIDALITLLCVGGTRFALRLAVEWERRHRRQRRHQGPAKRVLIAGAGETGALVLREIIANPQTGLVPVGFVDDDPSKLGMHLHRFPVMGTGQEIPSLVRQHQIDQVVIAMPTAPGRTLRQILTVCQQAGIDVRTVPALSEIVAGRIHLQQIREVRIEDLLRREPVMTDTNEVAGRLRGRRVVVTGAGGSIGSELCRQIALCNPAQLILLGHGENSIFEIHNELLALQRAGLIHCELQPVIADIRFPERLQAVFRHYRPQIVFHAAAHKHVPLMEISPEDAVLNNVEGTRNLVKVSLESGVGHFVLISTDKAINPTSVMGATKRAAEIIVQQAARQSGRCYVAVRFGNVLGSRGSVVPFFQKQIAAGGPVTVTHPDMRRYFMTIPEAVQLVLQAGALGQGGEVFVLDMGEPVRIADLATDLIRLSGLEPGRDVEVQYTGLRPGEKLFEELFADREAFTRTSHSKIFVARCEDAIPELFAGDTAGAGMAFSALLDQLQAAARAGDPSVVRYLLHAIVPEYAPGLPNPAAIAVIGGATAPDRSALVIDRRNGARVPSPA